MQTLPFAAALFVSLSGLALAQQNVTLDGASGNETFNVARSTTGGLTIGLGFEVEYLLIGGGGAGGSTVTGDDGVDGTGGGGAGGFVEGTVSLANQSYGISVGAGGSGATRGVVRGENGGNTTFSTFTATGGGGGGGYGLTGNTGGSGGGGGGRQNTAGGSATSGQGFAGGNAQSGNTMGQASGGGGGGAGGAGQAGDTVENGGDGGIGKTSTITGQSVYYAGGGGGAGIASNGDSQGQGGLGGGGNASRTGNGGAGTNGLGGGGGGVGDYGAGGNGGSGIVVVRYKGASAGTGGTITTGTNSAAGYTLHTFTNTGTSALDLSGLNLNSRLGAVENGVISGSGGLTFNGPGTLSLAAANTFTGDTRVGSGTLSLNHSNALASSTLNMASSDNGTVAFGLAGNNTYNIGGITGSRNLAIGSNVLSVGAKNENSTYSGQISGIGSLTKTGSGKLIISGDNTYTGATAVNDGSLAVNGSLGNTAVSVGSTATLQGSGSIGGSVTITSAGTLSAGNSIESLAMGTLTLQSGANFIQEVDSSATVGTQADLVVVNGDLNIANEAVSLTLTDLAGSWNWTENTKLTMINYSGAWNGGLFIMNGDVLEDDSIISWNTSAVMGWRINYNDTTGGSNYSSEQTLSKIVTQTAVPDPTGVPVGGLGALLLLRRRRA
ncbi:MAG: glycine-rich domain-containing protein [Verrucomicrobiota bacterium]